MRTVTFRSVLDGVAYSLRMDPANLQAADLHGYLENINERVKTAVEHEFFQELMRYERRAFRPGYAAGTAYAAGDEVYDAASDAYYQALKATTGNAPATSTGGTWTTNFAYWFPSAASYSGDDWETGLVLAAGDEVRNPADGEYYACHTAHTAGATFDATKFGLLTPFSRSVDLDQAGQTPIGEVWRVTMRDPRVYRTNAGDMKFTTAGSAILVQACGPTRPWVAFRIRPPQFTTEAFDEDLEGGYGLNDLVYDEDSGECYRSLKADNEDALDVEASWVKVDFPYIISAYVKSGVKADVLRADGQDQEADRIDVTALEKLSQADDVATTGQGQSERATARTH